MEWFNCTEPEELLIYALIISIGLSKNLTEDEMNALGNFFILIGQNLQVISDQKALNEQTCPDICKNDGGLKTNDIDI